MPDPSPTADYVGHLKVTTWGATWWYRPSTWWYGCCPFDWRDESGQWHECHEDRQGFWRRWRNHYHHCECGAAPA